MITGFTHGNDGKPVRAHHFLKIKELLEGGYVVIEDGAGEVIIPLIGSIPGNVTKMTQQDAEEYKLKKSGIIKPQTIIKP